MTAQKGKTEQKAEAVGKWGPNGPEGERAAETERLDAETAVSADQTGSITELSSLEGARQEAAENHDKYLRLAADFDNYKKRTQKDRADLLNYGNESLIRDILPIVDNLERALDHSDGSGMGGMGGGSAFFSGLQLILEQLKGTLARHGVEPVEAVGKEFDPNLHEAMLRIDSDAYRDNEIVEEFEKGYLLKGRLLRPAKVSVAKHPR